MSDYYSPDGEPLALLDWAAQYEMLDRHVGKTTVGDLLVSTVWLGINHNFSMHGPPLIFETMVFRDPDGEFDPVDEYSRRYSTRAQAEAGHADTSGVSAVAR